MPIQYQTNERLQTGEYLDFLLRTDLGNQYPREDFLERVDTLMKHYIVSATARTGEGLLVGVALGLTDFAYYMLVTDLGVARDYEKQGIGKQLLTLLHQAAGGKNRICVFLDSADDAVGFYENYGMHKGNSLMAFDAEPWTFFRLTPEIVEQFKASQ
ncbi:MAG: GNAT family N-acetyltransferase [Anaerolineae bacterium]|jgi:ribosomal protein S18 acetylase RimI-like enzyme|nr:GNAT family N-acetyltransferase [Anaerolineae bacterium]